MLAAHDARKVRAPATLERRPVLRRNPLLTKQAACHIWSTCLAFKFSVGQRQSGVVANSVHTADDYVTELASGWAV